MDSGDTAAPSACAPQSSAPKEKTPPAEIQSLLLIGHNHLLLTSDWINNASGEKDYLYITGDNKNITLIGNLDGPDFRRDIPVNNDPPFDSIDGLFDYCQGI